MLLESSILLNILLICYIVYSYFKNRQIQMTVITNTYKPYNEFNDTNNISLRNRRSRSPPP